MQQCCSILDPVPDSKSDTGWLCRVLVTVPQARLKYLVDEWGIDKFR